MCFIAYVEFEKIKDINSVIVMYFKSTFSKGNENTTIVHSIIIKKKSEATYSSRVTQHEAIYYMLTFSDVCPFPSSARTMVESHYTDILLIGIAEIHDTTQKEQSAIEFWLLFFLFFC